VKPGERRLEHLAHLLAFATGAGWAWFKYFGSGSTAGDPYSNATSPWEPRFHDWHVIVVPLLVYACGVLWHGHVLPQLRGRHSARLGAGKKWSGLGMLAVLGPMILTGYLIQVSVEESWRKAWVAGHLVTSVGWSLAYGWHWAVRAWRESRAA
jgi:hypothetical protein